MRMFAICSNYHTAIGLRLVGVDGVVVSTQYELEQEIHTATTDPSIGIIFVEKELAYTPDTNISSPIIVTLP